MTVAVLVASYSANVRKEWISIMSTKEWIDLRSDTVTKPTEEMRKAMALAEVGDDVYGDDPTINRLEEVAAKLAGKEAALFVPSGTMGNQLAVFTHCQRGDEVILAEDNHIVIHEAGGAAIIAGVQLRCLPSGKGYMKLSDVEKTIRYGLDIHEPRTGLICTENAHSTGVVHSMEYMTELYRLAVRKGIPVHLDGARLFNAASYLGVEASEVAACADSVMFCLSKGLCAPVGSILAGTKDFVEKARRRRKILGGGMRQAGILGAAGLIALEKMTLRVSEDHAAALYAAEALDALDGITVFKDDVHINMVFMKIEKEHDPEAFAEALKDRGVLVNAPENGILRIVFHYFAGKEQAKEAVSAIKAVLA